jgi:hypothetical protein
MMQCEGRRGGLEWRGAKAAAPRTVLTSVK